MNKKQIKAAEAVARALRRCAKLGLQGGVYDGNFCLWPRTANPIPPETGGDFFNRVNEIGILLDCNQIGMTDLDGGSGV